MYIIIIRINGYDVSAKGRQSDKKMADEGKCPDAEHNSGLRKSPILFFCIQ